MIIAIDGPAGAGKSTISRLIAQRLGFLYIDTGAMYRALTLKFLENKVDFSDVKKMIKIAANTNLDLTNNSDGSLKITLDGRDVSKEIRKQIITKYVSFVAKIEEIRDLMLGLQRTLGKTRNSVLDGRDIGTVVFPDAEKKFYFDADFKERVKRRHKELVESGQVASPEEVQSDIENRDTIDSTRKVAPLKKAEDARYIDTTNMTIEEVLYKVLEEINKA